MLTVTSVDAQNRFGELLDKSQREPVTITRRGRPVAVLMAIQEFEAQPRAGTPLQAIAAFRGAGGRTSTVEQLLADRRAEAAREAPVALRRRKAA